MMITCQWSMLTSASEFSPSVNLPPFVVQVGLAMDKAQAADAAQHWLPNMAHLPLSLSAPFSTCIVHVGLALATQATSYLP